MVLYEVNLTIDSDIFLMFKLWLDTHVKQILKFPCFVKANLLEEEGDYLSAQEKLTVQYYLEDKKALERYLFENAAKMREEGLQRFNNKFAATRRIFTIYDTLKS